MRHLFPSISATAVVLLAFVLFRMTVQNTISAEPQSPPQTQPATLRADVAAKAKAVFEMLRERRSNGEPLTPSFVDLYCNWSRKMALAQRDAATSKAEKIAALEDHLRRMKNESRVVVFDAGPHGFELQNAIGEYYADEAAALVAEAKK
jgi:hypothetical protein